MSRHRRPLPPEVPRRAAWATLLFLLIAAAVGGARSAGADPVPASPPVAGTARTACTESAARQSLPAGWTLECRSELPPDWNAATGDRPTSAMSSRAERRIVVLEGQSPGYTEASMTHEIAHAEASSWPPELRAAFARAVGGTTWSGPGTAGTPAPGDAPTVGVGGGQDSPAEVFAESSVRCRGLPTHASFPLVPCELVEAARAAGGARGPLPVSGSVPTETPRSPPTSTP